MEDALLDTVLDKLDDLQFAYRQGRGVDDATGMRLNTSNIFFFFLLCFIYKQKSWSRDDRHHVTGFVDDSIIVSPLSSDNSEHSLVESDCMGWCISSFLNMAKNKGDAYWY